MSVSETKKAQKNGRAGEKGFIRYGPERKTGEKHALGKGTESIRQEVAPRIVEKVGREFLER